jgi:isopentenyldiphosphate isomerase
MEKIDVFDADLRYIGVEDRDMAHLLGLWHKTFHLWVLTPRDGGKLLYQWRSREMKNFPDMLDVSAAGHLTAGESLPDGIREAKEELGIDLDQEKLFNLGYRVEVADQKNGQKNREYQGVHIAIVDMDLEEFKPQVEEVSGLYWVPNNDGIMLFQKKKLNINCKGIVYDQNEKSWKSDERLFTFNDFLPRIQQYYLTIHIMAERLLEKKFPLAIS